LQLQLDLGLLKIRFLSNVFSSKCRKIQASRVRTEDACRRYCITYTPFPCPFLVQV